MQQILFTLCESVFGQIYLGSGDVMTRSIMQRIAEDIVCTFAQVQGWGASLGCAGLIQPLLTGKKTAFPSKRRTEIAGGNQKYFWHKGGFVCVHTTKWDVHQLNLSEIHEA